MDAPASHGFGDRPARSRRRHEQPLESTISGTLLIAVLTALVVLTFVVNLVAARHNRTVARDERVGVALVADPVRAHQQWRITASGAQWTVVARTGSARDVGRVRHYLRNRNKQFHLGDYSDPLFAGLPADGRAELQTGAARLELVYREVPDGASLTWRPLDTGLLPPLHAWVRALATEGHTELLEQ